MMIKLVSQWMSGVFECCVCVWDIYILPVRAVQHTVECDMVTSYTYDHPHLCITALGFMLCRYATPRAHCKAQLIAWPAVYAGFAKQCSTVTVIIMSLCITTRVSAKAPWSTTTSGSSLASSWLTCQAELTWPSRESMLTSAHIFIACSLLGYGLNFLTIKLMAETWSLKIMHYSDVFYSPFINSGQVTCKTYDFIYLLCQLQGEQTW